MFVRLIFILVAVSSNSFLSGGRFGITGLVCDQKGGRQQRISSKKIIQIIFFK